MWILILMQIYCTGSDAARLVESWGGTPDTTAPPAQHSSIAAARKWNPLPQRDLPVKVSGGAGGNKEGSPAGSRGDAPVQAQGSGGNDTSAAGGDSGAAVGSMLPNEMKLPVDVNASNGYGGGVGGSAVLQNVAGSMSAAGGVFGSSSFEL